MGHQNAHYLKCEGKTYYFSQRVPKSLQQNTSVYRVEYVFIQKAVPMPSAKHYCLASD